MFKVQLGSHKRVFCSSGNDTTIVPKFALSVDNEGCQCLKQVGIHNLYQEIQNYKDGCDMASILSNLDPAQVGGLMSSFDIGDLRNIGVIDITKIPKNYGDFLNRMKEASSIFEGLPNEVRSTFNYSPDLFLRSIGDGSIDSKLANFIDKHIDNPAFDNNPVVLRERSKRRGRPPKPKDDSKPKDNPKPKGDD